MKNKLYSINELRKIKRKMDKEVSDNFKMEKICELYKMKNKYGESVSAKNGIDFFIDYVELKK